MPLTLPPCDYQPHAYDGPTREEVLRLRQTYLSPAIRLYYANPVMVVEGYMQYVWDETGRRYLDAIGGIVSISVGHCHPKVMESVAAQNERLQHTTTIYLHPTVAEFAKKLVATLPDGLDTVYFTNSGSEANDLAVLMARAFTGNFDIVALRNAYHGGSQGAMGLTSHSTWKHAVPHGFGVHHAMAPDRYRGIWGYDDPDAGANYAADVADVIAQGSCGAVAGFIAEPIQGVGGAVEMPPGYLEAAYGFVREAGGMCIADEVQTGFGRTGDNFWGFENHGVVPDMVTMAKGMGDGAPIAAVVTSRQVSESLATALHFNTFGGNPVSCAQGMATLEVLLDEDYQGRALRLGKQLFAGLRGLQERHPVIGDIRGRGLMSGMELVTDREEKTPAVELTATVHERCKDLGLLIGKGGYFGNVLRIKPPMCLGDADVQYIIDVLDEALG